jgi:hypothetical protein
MPYIFVQHFHESLTTDAMGNSGGVIYRPLP